METTWIETRLHPPLLHTAVREKEPHKLMLSPSASKTVDSVRQTGCQLFIHALAVTAPVLACTVEWGERPDIEQCNAPWWTELVGPATDRPCNVRWQGTAAYHEHSKQELFGSSSLQKRYFAPVDWSDKYTLGNQEPSLLRYDHGLINCMVLGRIRKELQQFVVSCAYFTVTRL